MKTCLALLLACSASLANAAQHQTVNASASVSNLQIELIDLRPDDGIPAQFRAYDSPFYYMLDGALLHEYGDVAYQGGGINPDHTVPLSFNYRDEYGNVKGSMDGRNFALQISSTGAYAAYGYAGYVVYGQLGSYSALRLRGSIQLDSQNPDDSAAVLSHVTDWPRNRWDGVFFSGGNGPQSRDFDFTLGAGPNPSDVNFSVIMNLLAYRDGVTPVPEADTWAMLGLGLLGLGGLVRRRKQA